MSHLTNEPEFARERGIPDHTDLQMDTGMNTPRIPNKGMRFFAGVTCALPSVFSMQGLLLAPRFGKIYSDMLPGRPLPIVTSLILRSYPWTALLPIAVLLVTITVLCVSRREHLPFYVAGIGLLLSVLIAAIIYLALYSPLVTIITELQ